MKRLFPLCLMLLMVFVFASAALAQPTVAVVTSGQAKRPATLKVAPEIFQKAFEAKGVVVKGTIVVPKDNSSAVSDPAALTAQGRSLGADYVLGVYGKTNAGKHIGYTSAEGDFSYLFINCKTGAVVDQYPAKSVSTNAGQNSEALVMRGATLAAGVTAASGALPHVTHWASAHPAAFRTAGWIGIGLSLIPWQSRCSAEKAVYKKFAEGCVAHLIPMM